MNGNDPKREHPAVLNQTAAMQRQLDEDMTRFNRLCDEDNGDGERLFDRTGIAKNDDLRPLLKEPPLDTPEELELYQRPAT